MMLPFRLQPASFPSALSRVWRWYRRELAGLVKLMTRRLPLCSSIVVRIEEGGTPAVPAGVDAHSREIILEIPPSEVLSRTVTLPAGARRHLTAILLNDLDRLSPLRPDLVYASCHLMERHHSLGSITTELRLVRRQWLDSALKSCTDAGVAPSRLCFEDGRPARHGRLPPLCPPPLSLRLARVATVALLVALPVELAATAFMKAGRQEDELALVLAETAKARIEAQAVERTKAAAASVRASIEALIREKEANRPSAILAALSETVPPDSWAFGVRIDKEQIRISGFSQSASALLSVVENSQAFQKAQFRSPVVRNTQNDQERFEMTFETEARQ